jgi:hypothetical protein
MMRRDASLTKYRASIEEAMARIGDEALGAETSARAREDLAYWKKTGPGLSHGWWEGKGISSREAEAVRNRMRQTLATVKLLRLNRLAASEKEKVIAEIRGLWASLPQLKDIAEVLDVIDEAKKQLR